MRFRALFTAALTLLLGATLVLPANAAGHNFGPITQTNNLLAPGSQEAVTVPAVMGSGVSGHVLMTQTYGLWTLTGTATGIPQGQVAVSVQYQNHSCALNGSENLADFIAGVWLPSGQGNSVLMPLPKSTATVQIQGVNAISIRVINLPVSAPLLLSLLSQGIVPPNLIPFLAPAKACGVR